MSRPLARNRHEVAARIDMLVTRLGFTPPPKRLGPKDRPIMNDTKPTEPTTREMCTLSHVKAEERGLLLAERSPAALVGALLSQMSTTSAVSFLDVAVRTIRSIVNDEKENGS